MSRPRTPTAVLEARGSFNAHPERARDRADEPRPNGPLGPPPPHLTAREAALFEEMAKEGHWLTSADALLVEVAANLMAQQRAGTIENPARSLLVTTLTRLGFGPTERSKIKVPEAPKANPFDAFA